MNKFFFPLWRYLSMTTFTNWFPFVEQNWYHAVKFAIYLVQSGVLNKEVQRIHHDLVIKQKVRQDSAPEKKLFLIWKNPLTTAQKKTAFERSFGKTTVRKWKTCHNYFPTLRRMYLGAISLDNATAKVFCCAVMDSELLKRIFPAPMIWKGVTCRQDIADEKKVQADRNRNRKNWPCNEFLPRRHSFVL